MAVDIRSEPAKSDQLLIAEIAPAIRRDLRFWGAIQGGSSGALLLFALLHFAQRYGESSILWVMAPMIWGFVGVPAWVWFAQRDAVLRQVRYRRQRGKWRWDR